jgi:toxin ParE1/3/4
MSYKLTPEAENDLIKIYLFGFQNFGEAQAENYFSELEEVFRMLGETPLICRERLEFSPPVRIHPHGRHLIVYVIDTDRILIVRVLHHSMDVPQHLSDV